MNHLILTVLSIILFFGVVSGLPATVHAQDLIGLEPVSQSGLTKQDPRIVITSMINVALQFLGIIAVLIMLYAGFTWMTAGGNEEKVATAKKTLFAAVGGLIIIMVSYSISVYVLTVLHQVTSMP